MIGIENRGAQELLDPMSDSIQAVREEWAGKGLPDVYKEMPLAQHIELNPWHRVETVTLDAIDGEYDGSDVVIALPHLQGWTPHHYIRTRVMQQLDFPNSRVHVLPRESDSVLLSDEDRRLMAKGIDPTAEYQMRALEALGLGVTAMTGYSEGGLTVLRLAHVGSDVLELIKVNADEVPHEKDRDAKKLTEDFMKSGGVLALYRAIHEADIQALSEAMNLPRMSLDMIRFALRSFQKDSRLIKKTMTGTSNVPMAGAVHQLGGQNVKVGYIEGSRIFNIRDFDLSSLPIAPVEPAKGPRVVQYGGKGFHKHASADNVILHAAMVNDGLR